VNDRFVLPDDAASTIEANVDRIVRLITNSAQHMAAKLNGQVYLVGSSLHKPAPRDCDVRVIVADHEFAARFGFEVKRCDEAPTKHRLGRTAKVHWDDDGPSQRWIDDCAKTGAEWSVRLGLNVDYKVWPESYWREGTYPTPLLLAAPSAEWFVYSRFCPDPTFGRRVDEGEGAE
jgi:hypothetical protein